MTTKQPRKRVKKETEHNFCPLCGFCGNFHTKREHKFYHALWFNKTHGIVKSLALHHHPNPRT